MARLADKYAIRALLQRDPLWSVYALGDLSAAMFPKTQWFGPDLSLIFHDYGTNILFAMGTGSIREALDHVTWPVHLQVQADAWDEIARHASVENQRLMWRMGWSGRTATTPGSAVRLAAADVPALQKLYRDGEATGESPDFFHPSMVTDGVFFGVYEDHALAAAIGNIYTTRNRRGRGLGRVVTSAVLEAVNGIETVGLNVRADNVAASPALSASTGASPPSAGRR